MKYKVKLRDGTEFTGERPWYYSILESFPFRWFKNVLMNADNKVLKGRLHVPTNSILYIIEQR